MTCAGSSIDSSRRDGKTRRVRWAPPLVIGLILASSAAPARGTVYTWRESDGVDHFTNALDDVPEAYRPTAKTSVRRSEATSGVEVVAPAKPTGAEVVAPAKPTAPPRVAVEDDSYLRGVERGAKIALEQTRAVGELARSLVEALRRDDGPREIRRPEPPPEPRNPGFYVSVVPAGRRWPERIFHGAIGPAPGCTGCCCGTTFGYGFGGGRLIPHSHFFPTIEAARRVGLFFPHGHQLDADLFLVGDGYWVD